VRTAVIFDFDGTLYDTEPLIREAYAVAGADPGDVDVMRQSYREWLVPRVGAARAEEIHRLKDSIYAAFVGERATPICGYVRTAQSLDQCGHLVGILSGAPLVAAPAIRHMLHPSPFRLFRLGLNLEQKIEIMQALGPNGVYVDDDPRGVEVENIGWTFVPAGQCLTCVVDADPYL
jgi:hypothetical protein